MKNRGFGLVELLIALALFAMVVAGIARFNADQRRQQVAARLVAEYVGDYMMISRASREYVSANKGPWAASSVNVITVAMLRTAGFLPTSYAVRSTGDGTTPFGNTFRIVSIKAATGTVASTVIGETGNAIAARLEAAGIAADATGIAQFKRQVAAKLAEQGLAAGTIIGGTTVVTSAGTNGWTKALGTYFPTAPTQMAVATLIGFPDLEVDGGGGAPDDAPTYGTCTVQPARCHISSNPQSGSSDICSGSYMTPLNAGCPVGQTMLKQFTHCMGQGTVIAAPEIGSSLTAGRDEQVDTQPYKDSHQTYCFDRCNGNVGCQTQCGPGRTQGNTNDDAVIYIGKVSINNVPVSTYTCRTERGNYLAALGTYGSYHLIAQNGPNAALDALCCTPAP